MTGRNRKARNFMKILVLMAVGLSMTHCFFANKYRLNWQEAVDYCENLNLDGQTGWRLPTVNEMKTLAEYERASDKCGVPDDFKGLCGVKYWTATESLSDRSYRDTVEFSKYEIKGRKIWVQSDETFKTHFVICVKK